MGTFISHSFLYIVLAIIADPDGPPSLSERPVHRTRRSPTTQRAVEREQERQYVIAWDNAKKTLGARNLSRAIEAWGKAPTEKKEEAFGQFHRTLGFKKGYSRKLSDRDLNRLWDQWKDYPDRLNKVIEKHVPVLLEAPPEARERRLIHRRAEAAMLLAEEAPHPSFLPLLKAIVGNSDESKRVRYCALTSIARIPSDDCVDYLIDLIDDSEIGHRAVELVRKMTGVGFERGNSTPAELKKKYRAWYDKKGDAFVYTVEVWDGLLDDD